MRPCWPGTESQLAQTDRSNRMWTSGICRPLRGVHRYARRPAVVVALTVLGQLSSLPGTLLLRMERNRYLWPPGVGLAWRVGSSYAATGPPFAQSAPSNADSQSRLANIFRGTSPRRFARPEGSSRCRRKSGRSTPIHRHRGAYRAQPPASAGGVRACSMPISIGMSDIVLDHGGTIDKFVGDAVSTFGARQCPRDVR